MIKELEDRLVERFALQRDVLLGADLSDVRRRARVLNHGVSMRSRTRRFAWRRPMRRGSLIAGVATLVVACGTATAFAVRALTQSPVTSNFSALSDAMLPQVTSTTPGVDPQVARFFDEQLGAGYTARQVGDGMFLAQRGSDLCEAVTGGAAGCTDHLDGSVWLFGDEKRAYDAETAPFNVHVYGFAQDGVVAVHLTTSDGSLVTVPVEHNAFETTLTDMTFADITAVDVESSSGHTTTIDPRRFFPATPPNMAVTTG